MTTAIFTYQDARRGERTGLVFGWTTPAERDAKMMAEYGALAEWPTGFTNLRETAIEPAWHGRFVVGEVVPDKTWEIMGELAFDSAVLRARVNFPIGFVTDLASTPRLPLVYLCFGGICNKEGAGHDLLYQTHLCADQATADLVFLELMILKNLERWRRFQMYETVRTQGEPHWTSGPERYVRLGNQERLG